MDYEERFTIGGCKGVMLCDRPFGKGENPSERKTCDKVAKAVGSFICGSVKRPWGSNVVIPEKSRVLNRLSQKNEVLNKHKKWLNELQKRKDARIQQKSQEEKDKETRKRNFMARSAKKRALARLVNSRNCFNDENESMNEFDPENPFHSNAPNSDDSDEENIVDTTNTKIAPQRKNILINHRPAWSLTKIEANRLGEESESREEESLLAFVKDLNIEKYSEDLELKLLMDQVKRRINLLEKDTLHDEKRLQVVEEVEQAKEHAALYNNDVTLDTFFSNHHKDRIGDDDLSIVDSVRSDHSIRSIHSQKSINALIARAKEKLNIAMEPILEEPVLSTLVEDDGRRIAETKSLNKLPFKNRNPAL